MGRRLKTAAQVLALLLVAGLFALLGWKVTHQSGGGKLVSDAQKGAKPMAPAFRLERLNGDGHLELASLRNKVVLVNFWATWCDPCKREIPLLQKAWQRYQGKDVVFVGIDAQDFDSSARRAIETYGITYPVVYDGTGKVIDKYGGLPLPRTFVINRRGKIVDYQLGQLDSADITRMLTTALRPA
jgi:thiol-disulfide isomerase/thioredoxin